MKITKKTFVAIALLGISVTLGSFGNDASAQGNRGRRQGPPPEAYTACEGKSAGDTAEFESPQGDTVTGTCEEDRDGKLVLRPDNPPEGDRGGRGQRNSDD
ncbi:hypothetical protein DENIS_2888 [Desulfonema ishimotonii]|uniref:Uncharacterized protein n=1 Tax=Desulfonema ishimotonii TaxID=45657 RepID=A0A401FYA9_9BACT|nr:hypothetical protein [Desulfonema ishimotonii]GBC61926.1 hypothetical protein DENIS_2888 [Desulfonema ishimotonii]